MSTGSGSTGSGGRWRVSRAVLAAFWLATVAALTLTPHASAFERADLPQLSACLICGERGTSDALLNLLLLAPLGLLLNDWGWRPLRVAGAALALSASIELTQHFIPGRYSNLGDVVWNTTGAWTAALLWSLRDFWLPGNARHAAHLRKVAVLIPPVVTLVFGWLMAPDWPAEPYWGQWTPDLGFMEQYQGKVIRARLDTMPLPSHRLRAPDHPRDLLMHDWTLDAVVVKGPPPTTVAPIVNIYDGKPEEVTMLGAVGQDLVYRERTRASHLRLDDPARWYLDVLARADVGDTIRVGVARRGWDRCLVLDGSAACPGFTPGRAWALLMPLPLLSPGAREGLDASCMFLLLLPLGFWCTRRREMVVSGLMATILLGVAVAVSRIVTPPWTEVLGAVLGLFAGRALRAAVGVVLEKSLWRGPGAGSILK